MPILFTCPHCGSETNVAEAYLGSTGPCAHCGRMVTIPSADGETSGAGAADPSRTSSRTPGATIVSLIGLAGFSLVVILMMAGFVMFKYSTAKTITRRNAKVAVTKSQIGLTETALKMYQLDMGEYPTTEQGLDALQMPPADMVDPSQWNGPYVNGSPQFDVWGNPYQYESPGNHNPDTFDLWSFGPDISDGTADDVGNWL